VGCSGSFCCNACKRRQGLVANLAAGRRIALHAVVVLGSQEIGAQAHRVDDLFVLCGQLLLSAPGC
jgi:hypothetical protein